MDYRLLVSLDVVEFLERLSPRQRGPLRQAIGAIRGDPFGRSDATEYDAGGRLLHIAIVGGFALTYWIDDDRHVKIMDLHAADR